jgi:hypothetical protein
MLFQATLAIFAFHQCNRRQLQYKHLLTELLRQSEILVDIIIVTVMIQIKLTRTAIAGCSSIGYSNSIPYTNRIEITKNVVLITPEISENSLFAIRAIESKNDVANSSTAIT